jgi:hypothetical protein
MRVSNSQISVEDFEVGGDFGWLHVLYYPDNAMDEITNFFYYYLGIDDEDFSSGRAETISAHYLTHAGKLLREQIKQKLTEALVEIVYEVEEQTLREIGKLTSAQANEACERLKQTIKRAKKDRIKPPARGGSTPDYDLSKLRINYDNLLPSWQEAKRIFRQNRNNPRWREMVIAAAPDLSEQRDLIERLDEYPKLPSNILAKIDKQGSESRPSHITLEHAARLCGCPPYHYSLRHLQGRVKGATKKR